MKVDKLRELQRSRREMVFVPSLQYKYCSDYHRVHIAHTVEHIEPSVHSHYPLHAVHCSVVHVACVSTVHCPVPHGRNHMREYAYCKSPTIYNTVYSAGRGLLVLRTSRRRVTCHVSCLEAGYHCTTYCTTSDAPHSNQTTSRNRHQSSG